MKISFIGLGKLGLCSASCFASKGNTVIGVDNNPLLIKDLSCGKCPIEEPGLETLLEDAQHNIEFTSDYTEAIYKTDITLIIVPTPSDENGAFSNTFVLNVLETIGPILKRKSEFHVIGIVSTVMPTSCNKYFIPLLENLTQKTCGRDFGLVYNPEFIALGSVIKDFLNPDIVLIGSSDSKSAEITKDLYASMVENQPEYQVMSLINAEITKLALNCFVTMKISYVNELSSVCEKTNGADIDIISNAIGCDSRVGKKYLKGGLGFGGPCFPRDNLAFQRFARSNNLNVKISPSVISVNNSVVDRIENRVTSSIEPDSTIALLGLSYKSNTHIIEESQSIMLAKKLAQQGYTLHLHDPKAKILPEAIHYKSVKFFNDPYEATLRANAVILLTDWSDYHILDWYAIEQNCSGLKPLLFDSWRQLKNMRFERFQYAALGYGPQKENL